MNRILYVLMLLVIAAGTAHAVAPPEDDGHGVSVHLHGG